MSQFAANDVKTSTWGIIIPQNYDLRVHALGLQTGATGGADALIADSATCEALSIGLDTWWSLQA